MSMININKIVASGQQAVASWNDAQAVIALQRGKDMSDVAALASSFGASTADILGAQAITGIAELGSMPRTAVWDAMDAARQVRRTDVALITNGAPDHGLSLGNLVAELEARGAQPRFLNAFRMKVEDGRLLYRGPAKDSAFTQIQVPEAAFARGASSWRIADLENLGVHFGNRPSTRTITTSKSEQARVFHEAGVAHPRTIPDLTNASEVRRAVDELGYPSVVKKNNGYGGQGVWIVNSSDELERVAAKNFADADGPHGLLVQQYIDVGAADYRHTVVRQPDGTMRATSLHHRQGAGDDGLANGPQGSLYTRIPITEAPAGQTELAEKAAQSLGLDYAGIDVVVDSKGKNWVLEGNSTPGFPEVDLPLAREEHTLPKLADWLVYGQR